LKVDLSRWDASEYPGVSLFAGGVPCPPFSKAGKRLGKHDERDLFPAALDRIEEGKPRAVMLANVPSLMGDMFTAHRQEITARRGDLGLRVHDWRLVHASDFGVPQLRPRSVMVALRDDAYPHFVWPETKIDAPTVGEALREEMGRNGWQGAEAWSIRAGK